MHFRFNGLRSVWSRLEAEKLSYFRKLWKKGGKIKKGERNEKRNFFRAGLKFQLSVLVRSKTERSNSSVWKSSSLCCACLPLRRSSFLWFEGRTNKEIRSGSWRLPTNLLLSFWFEERARHDLRGNYIRRLFFQLSINSRRKSLATRSFVLEQAANAFTLILRSGRSWVWSIITSLFLKERTLSLERFVHEELIGAGVFSVFKVGKLNWKILNSMEHCTRSSWKFANRISLTASFFRREREGNPVSSWKWLGKSSAV